MKSSTSSCKDSVYTMVTERLISQLNDGNVPWHRASYGTDDKPIGYLSRKPYEGINLLLLEPGEYITWKQIQELGGSVNKGATSYPVFFYKKIEKKETDPETGEEKIKVSFVFRYYRVFKLSDTSGIASKSGAFIPPANPQAESDIIFTRYLRQEISTGLSSEEKPYALPVYDEENDVITVPVTPDAKDAVYFAKLFRTLVHSTGNGKRLGRAGYDTLDIMDRNFGKEELVKEMGGAMLLNCAGYNSEEDLDNSRAYCEKWIKRLQADSRLAIVAAARAEKAVRYILNDHPDTTVITEDLALS